MGGMRLNLYAVLPILLLGCGLLTFDAEGDASTHIDGSGVLGSLLGVLDFTGLDDFDVDVQNAMADQDVEPGDLKSVSLTAFTLSADPGDLAFLDSFEVTIVATGVDQATIATGTEFPEGEPVVQLDLVDLDLTPYIVASDASIGVVASGSAPEDDVDVRADYTVQITATPRGACRQLAGDDTGS